MRVALTRYDGTVIELLELHHYVDAARRDHREFQPSEAPDPDALMKAAVDDLLDDLGRAVRRNAPSLLRRDQIEPGMVVRSSHGYYLLVTEVLDTAEVRTDERHVQITGHLHGHPGAELRNERYPAGSLIEVQA
jgi:hypothetical protein